MLFVNVVHQPHPQGSDHAPMFEVIIIAKGVVSYCWIDKYIIYKVLL